MDDTLEPRKCNCCKEEKNLNLLPWDIKGEVYWFCPQCDLVPQWPSKPTRA